MSDSTSRRFARRTMAAALLALFACEDAATSAPAEPDEGRQVPAFDAAPPPDLGPPPDARPPLPVEDAAPPPPPDRGVVPTGPQPGFVEVSLSPARALYGLSEDVRATAAVFDRAGEPLSAPVTFSVVPPGVATVSADGRLSLIGEGPAAVVACAAPQICGRANLFIDAAPPTLTLSAPTRGAALGGDGGRTIPVRGVAVDSRGDVDVRVNGVRVAVAPDGVFAVDLSARFGVNRVEVRADDGVQPPVIAQLDVLWAPTYTRADLTGSTVPAAATLQIEQGLLDAELPVIVPPEGGVLALTSLAEVLELLLRLAEPGAALGDPVVVDTEPLSLRIEEVSLGAPEVEVSLTPEGIELYLRVPDLTVRTTGRLALDGQVIPLAGAVRVALAAYAALGVRPDPNLGLDLALTDVQVAVESVAGDYPDATARALVATLGSALGDAARGVAVELVETLVAGQLPALLNAAVGDLIGALADVPLNLDTGLPGVPPVAMRFSLRPAGLTLRPREVMALDLRARVEHPTPPQAPHLDPGVPTLSAALAPEIVGPGLTIQLRLELINAILHAAWRAGLLNLSPPLPAEAAALLRSLSLDARLPPVLAPAPPGAPWPLEVQAGDLRVAVLPAFGGDEPDVYALSLKVGVRLLGAGGALALEVADAPDIRATLLSSAGPNPFLPPAALAGLMEALVWPQVQRTLAGGLSFGLESIALDAAALSAVAPRLRSLRIGPDLEGLPWLLDGRLVMEGGLGVEAVLAPR